MTSEQDIRQACKLAGNAAAWRYDEIEAAAARWYCVDYFTREVVRETELAQRDLKRLGWGRR